MSMHPRLKPANTPNLLTQLLLTALLVIAACSALPASAQEAATVSVDKLEKELDALTRQAQKPLDAKDTGEALEQASRVQTQAAALAQSQATPIAGLQERITLLGANAAKSNDPSVRSDYQRMQRELSTAEAVVQRASLIELDAQQLVAKLNFDRAQTMGRELADRASSPLTLDLWTDASSALPRELKRVQTQASREPPAPASTQATALGLWALACLLLLIPVRRLAIRWITGIAQRKSSKYSPFVASTYALARALTSFALVFLCLGLLHLLLDRYPLEGLTLAAVLTATSAVSSALMVVSLGYSLLRPIGPVADTHEKKPDPAAALALRIGLGVATIAGCATLGQRLVLGQSTQPALQAIEALVALLFLASALLQASRWRAAASTQAGEVTHTRFAALGVVITLSWLFVGALLMAWVLGYINLTVRLTRWSYWTLVVAGTAWLVMQFIDALCIHVGSAWKARARYMSGSKALDQIAVVLSAVLRLLVLALACGAFLVPFGAGFTSVLEVFGLMAQGFEVSGVTVSAWAFIRAGLAIATVFCLFKLIRWWMTTSYLPTTSLQLDARESVDKIIHYVGLVLAVLWGLTAFGVGMEKVAILASALSVGIGFGLQAITQNFVSGLILLVERPVKIGDWVKLGTMEGDIRRINVRSTEIQVADHSTLIVPNSELITKVVQNMTPMGARGRAQLMFSVDIQADLEQAIQIIKDVYAQDEAVLDVPAPAVFLDKIDAGTAVLNTFVHVATPRDAYGARSRLMLAVLKALRAAGIQAGLPPQQITLVPTGTNTRDP